MEIPTVRTIMSPFPQVVETTEEIATARQVMETYGIRHLPVMKDGELYGILSERDLKAVGAFLDESPGQIGPPVGSICSRTTFVVRPDAPLDDTAIEMANRRLGTVLVADEHRLVGIATTVDICRALATLVGRMRAAG